MKRIIAITILAIGLIPSLPVTSADAIVPNQEALQRHCRDRLGFGQTEPVYGSLLLQLRRCIDSTRTQYKPDLVHYSTVAKKETVTQRETQRTLNERMHNQERTRKSYYHNVPLADREFILQEHRRSKRLIVQEQERLLLRQRTDKLQRWRQALKTCTYYVRENRHDCVQFELVAP
ncbi:MAG: hypothetical protein O3A80_02210 [bacterium]|nr:hypothetical protein [bacterium]